MSWADPIARPVAGALGIEQAWVEAALLLVAGLATGLLARWLVLRHALPAARRTRIEFDELMLESIATPILLTLVLLGALGAARRLLVDAGWLVVADRVFTSVLLVVWGWAFARVAGQHILQRAQRAPGQSRSRGAVLVGRFMKALVAVVLLLTLFGVWGIAITPLLASAGIVGIALALAAQDTLANLFAGVAVYVDGLYEVGDFVVLDPGNESEVRGEVRDIGLRSTRILTRDDVLVVVPNSVIANGRVINETGQAAQYRVHVPTQVAYESELEHVERVMLRAVDAHPLVLAEPAPRVRFRKFEDSGIRVELLAWIADPRDRGPVVHDLMKRVHALFREEGIRIPFPQRDLHVIEPGGR